LLSHADDSETERQAKRMDIDEANGASYVFDAGEWVDGGERGILPRATTEEMEALELEAESLRDDFTCNESEVEGEVVWA